jgi:hypothetical protein
MIKIENSDNLDDLKRKLKKIFDDHESKFDVLSENVIDFNSSDIKITEVQRAVEADVAYNSYNAETSLTADHGTLSGLTHDDHTQYLLATGSRNLSGVQRCATSLYARYYHVALGSSNPGASGPTWVLADANTTGGWNLDADGEKLRGQVDIHSDWDGASDMHFTVRWCTDEDNSGGAAGDTVDLTLVVRYKGEGDTAVKSQTITAQSTTIGTAARYKQFKTDFTIDWNATSNVVEVGDVMSVNLNFVTATSEVSDIIVTSMEFYYNTTHIGIESGDT